MCEMVPSNISAETAVTYILSMWPAPPTIFTVVHTPCSQQHDIHENDKVTPRKRYRV